MDEESEQKAGVLGLVISKDTKRSAVSRQKTGVCLLTETRAELYHLCQFLV